MLQIEPSLRRTECTLGFAGPSTFIGNVSSHFRRRSTAFVEVRKLEVMRLSWEPQGESKEPTFVPYG